MADTLLSHFYVGRALCGLKEESFTYVTLFDIYDKQGRFLALNVCLVDFFKKDCFKRTI